MIFNHINPHLAWYKLDDFLPGPGTSLKSYPSWVPVHPVHQFGWIAETHVNIAMGDVCLDLLIVNIAMGNPPSFEDVSLLLKMVVLSLLC